MKYEYFKIDAEKKMFRGMCEETEQFTTADTLGSK